MNNKHGTLIFTELIVGKSLISPLTVAMVLGLANLHVMIIGKPAVKQCCAGALRARARVYCRNVGWAQLWDDPGRKAVM